MTMTSKTIFVAAVSICAATASLGTILVDGTVVNQATANGAPARTVCAT